jgi:dTDP-4-dehydrorhamnose reductase
MSNCKILVLGGSGMLGHKMFQTLRQQFSNTFCTTRRVEAGGLRAEGLLAGADVLPGVDTTDWERTRTLLMKLRPTVIVNCVGVIKQRSCASKALPLIETNSLLPHRLAATGAEWGGRLIHFSTDCVFSGKRGRYTEADPSDAEDLYGRTKYLGEVTGPNALTLRTSIIGRELHHFQSLLEWFLSKRGTTIRGYRRAIYSGVTSNYLADLVATIIKCYPDISGLYHVATEPISKYELLRLLRAAYAVDIAIEPSDDEVCDRSMLGAKFQQATGINLPDWSTLAAKMAEDKTPYERYRQ